MSTKRKITSRVLWKKLTDGDYRQIIDFASDPQNELDVQIRDNYLNIYYRGGNFLNIRPRSFWFDEFYFYQETTLRKTHLLEAKDKGEKKAIIKHQELIKKQKELLNVLSVKGVEEYSVKMKSVMDSWDAFLRDNYGINHDEKNEQQLISMNNRIDSVLTVIDLEYAVSSTSEFKYDGDTDKKVPRFDIIAVDRSGQLCVIELKKGLGAVGGASGIGPHIDCFDHTIGRDVNGSFRDEMKDLLSQKQELNLISKDVFINEKPPKFIFAFADKAGEDNYYEFCKMCRNEGYDDLIIYLDESHKLIMK